MRNKYAKSYKTSAFKIVQEETKIRTINLLRKSNKNFLNND